MGDEVFPYRFRLKPVKIFRQPVEIKPLIPELGSVTNKTMWSGHFRQAMREIPEEDYQKIMTAGKYPLLYIIPVSYHSLYRLYSRFARTWNSPMKTSSITTSIAG